MYAHMMDDSMSDQAREHFLFLISDSLEVRLIERVRHTVSPR